MYSMKNAILDMKITLDTMESRALDQDDITKIDAMINFLDHYQRIINITKDTTFSKEIEIIRRKAENYLNMNGVLFQSFYCQFMDSCYYLPSYHAFILQ